MGIDPAASRGEAPGGPRDLTLLVTAGLSGKLVDDGQGKTIASVVAAIRHEAEVLESEGREVLILDAGRTLVPYAESRHDRGRMMARILASMGCQVYAPSAIDLSLGAEAFDELETPFPILRPFVGADARWDSLHPWVTLETGEGLRLHVAEVFDPLFAGDLQDLATAEIRARKPQEAFDGLVDRDGLRLVVMHSKLRSGGLAKRRWSWDVVEQPHGIQLWLDPDFGYDMTIRRETAAGPVVLVGFEQDAVRPWTPRRIDLRLVPDDESWLIDSVSSRALEIDPALAVDPELEAEIKQAYAAFRAAHDFPLPAEAPDQRQALEEFILESIREAGSAEVAILSRGSLRPVEARYFESTPLRREAVMRLLSLDLQIGVVTLTGSQLQQLVATSDRRRRRDGTPRKDSLVFVGLAHEVDFEGRRTIRVNGRELHPKDPYKVAISRYLLSGGDNYRLLTRLEPEILLVDAEGQMRPAEVRDDIVLPRLERSDDPFIDLEERGLWRYGIDEATLYLDGVETRSGREYAFVPDSRANAEDSTSFRFDLHLRLDQEWPSWTWENRLETSFGLLDSESGERQEVSDNLVFESSAVLPAATSRRLGGDFFISLLLDSELRRNPTVDGPRRPRQLEQALSAGIEWAWGNWQRLRLGFIGRHYSNVDRSDRFGLKAEGHYRWPAAKKRPGFEGRFRIDSLYDGGEHIDRADVELRLLVPVWRSLELRPGLNFYNYRDSELEGSADYLRLSLGFAYSWAGKYQKLD